MTGADAVLPCGRLRGDLLALVVDGELEPADTELATHARDCPHCQAELGALDGRWGAVRAAAQAPVPVPDGLAARMLAGVRGLRGTFSAADAELDQGDGRLTVSARAVLTLARQFAVDAVHELPGVHLRGLTGDGAAITVAISVRYGVAADLTALRLRQTLRSRLAGSLDAAAPEVIVEVVDVLPPRPGIGLPQFE
ncbi:anti-sigma factor family protein [Crossiella cryophila]|uniref:Putative alkaline shock family protein YloU n=1 Tax=Crossiella cryophila TaxID=43355 RepID=A0A7W7C9I2_9PSEU|nr:hypothetical protein [Crossiella cryophila]MBB4677038.1 putative alkaline shock family protein YloU [Crossiella cryophila]